MSIAPIDPLHSVLAGPRPRLEKLRSKIDANRGLTFKAFAAKSLRFAAATARSVWLLHGIDQLGIGVRVLGLAPRIRKPGGRVLLGDDVIFDAKVTPIYFEVEPGAELSIGSGTYLNDGAWFGCTGKIQLGERVLIGPGVRVFDNDYHGPYRRRTMPAPRPVTIEDDVWLATNSIILPGVTIGQGAIVGAGSVVTHSVPAWTVVAGNPAREIKRLDPAVFKAARAEERR